MSVVARGAAITLASRLAAVALGLVITIITARMGTEAQGRFALFTAIEALLIALFSGFGMVLARQASSGGRLPSGLIGAVVAACLALGTGCAILMLSLARWGGESYALLWIFAIGAPLLLVPSNLAGIWLGEGRMLPIAWLTVASPLLTVALYLLLSATVQGWPAIMLMLLAWVIARCALGAMMILHARRYGHLHVVDGAALKAHLAFVATIGAANLVSLVNYKVDLFLVERYLGLAATGVYSIAILIAEALWLLSSSLTQSAYARIGTPERSAAADLSLRVLQANIVMLAAATPLLYFGAVLLLPLVFGPAYHDVPRLMLWFMPGIVAYGGASVMSAYFTNHAGRPAVPASMAMLSAVINVVLCVLLIPSLGAVGGAIATSVAYVLSMMTMIGLFLRHSGLPLASIVQVDLRSLLRAVRRATRRTAVDEAHPPAGDASR